MDNAKKFGILLRLLRKEKGLSQAKLAELCDLDRTYISLIERGLRNPTLDTIIQISSALDISLVEIFKKYEEYDEDSEN